MDEVTSSVEGKKNRTHFDFYAEYELLVSGGKKNKKKDVALTEVNINQEPKASKARTHFDFYGEYDKLVSGGKKGTKALAKANANHQLKEKPLQKKLVLSQSRPERENKHANKTLNFGLKRNLDLELDSNPIKRKKIDSDLADNSTSKLRGSIINSRSKAKKKLFGNSSSDSSKRKSLTPASQRKKAAAAVKIALSQKEAEPCYESDSSDVDRASMSEFLKLENECSMNMSPLSALSNQLQKTKINKQASKSLMDTINEITVKLENDFKQFNQTYMKGMDEIKNQLLKLEESKSIFYAGFVQNIKELNALKGSVDKTDVEKVKYICTPKLKSENLRVATLNKNLSKAVNVNKTPDRNMREAVKLYNCFKGELGSPILERANLQTPLATSQRYVAVKLQKQCLMLCDTPSKV